MALFKLGSKKKSNKNVKAGVGGKLKKQSKPKLAFLSLAALLLLTSTGYGGFTYYKQTQLQDAKAAGWTYLSPDGGGGRRASDYLQWMRACKVYMPNTGYGNLWKVSFQAYRKTTQVSHIALDAQRYGKYYGSTTTNYSWYYNVVSGADITVSRDLGDIVVLSARGYMFSFAGRLSSTIYINPYYLANC